jgi:hypothetical protein
MEGEQQTRKMRNAEKEYVRTRIKEYSLFKCDDKVREIAMCMQQESFLAVFKCREKKNIANDCLNI